MESSTILEIRGLIVKEERVKSLESNFLEDSLVLENSDAFPGYFGKNLPDANQPRSLFIILAKSYDEIFLARTIMKIGSKMHFKCYGSYGDITFNGKVFHCIRIKNLDCFPSVINIQRTVTDAGIGIMKYQKVDTSAIIRIHKSFLIKQISNGVYKDLFEPDRYYISIPYPPAWDDFKKITKLVKSNIENNLFDAALGFFWRIDGITDMIRIYDKKSNAGRIKTIRNKYLDVFKNSG